MSAIVSENIQLDESWKHLLQEEFFKDYFSGVKQFLLKEKAENKPIYPPGNKIFAALNTTPFNQVKVVILGQDPYHGIGQANGLCFSVSEGIKPPPSLLNIYKEIAYDTGIQNDKTNGDLSKWAEQGVLLLNAFLTVQANNPASHQHIGWQNFTDKIIQLISEKKENIVFILWGSFARTKVKLIDEKKHLILQSGHPSFADSHKQFFGNHHFSKTNKYLSEHGFPEIDWRVK